MHPTTHCNLCFNAPYRERIVLWCLSALQKERGDRHMPTGMLYGSVVEYVNMTVDEIQSILVRFIGHE